MQLCTKKYIKSTVIVYTYAVVLIYLQGIVTDIPFAPFFLSHMLEKIHYNYLDELASFDQQMYSSLNFIKVCLCVCVCVDLLFKRYIRMLNKALS